MALATYTGEFTVEALQITQVRLQGGGTGGGVLKLSDNSFVTVSAGYMNKYKPAVTNWYSIDENDVQECWTNTIFTARFTEVE